MLEIIRPAKVYDVCIIGSGAAGGAAAKVLTEGGLNVVMLEAGPPVERDANVEPVPDHSTISGSRAGIVCRQYRRA